MIFPFFLKKSLSLTVKVAKNVVFGDFLWNMPLLFLLCPTPPQYGETTKEKGKFRVNKETQGQESN